MLIFYLLTFLSPHGCSSPPATLGRKTVILRDREGAARRQKAGAPDLDFDAGSVAENGQEVSGAIVSGTRLADTERHGLLLYGWWSAGGDDV